MKFNLGPVYPWPGIILACLLMLLPVNQSRAGDCRECVMEKLEDLKFLPEKSEMTMLDGEVVNLHLFDFYPKLNLRAFVPPKFYYWDSEIIQFEAKGPPPSEEKVTYKARIYWSPASMCNCKDIQTARNDTAETTCGDFAEIYDINGKFIGFIKYIGDGLYIPMKYINYEPDTSRSGI